MEDDDEEAEQDEMLFECAGDVLPALGRAMTADQFVPIVLGLLPLVLKKTRKQCSSAERSFAVGTLADCVEPLAGRLEQFLPHAMPIFNEVIGDEEDDLRNNGVYGLGELVLWGGDLMVSHYNQILSNLSTLLAKESAPRVIDQIVGAVARFVAYPNFIPRSPLPSLSTDLAERTIRTTDHPPDRPMQPEGRSQAAAGRAGCRGYSR